MTRYQLLEGEHLEADGSEHGVRIKRGEQFASSNDWYERLWPEKFKKLDNQTNPAYVFDPTRESLEEFMRRIQALEEQGKQAQSSSVTNPASDTSVVDADDDYERDLESMTVPELQAQAHNAGIDLKGATRKSDIIKLIKAALLASAAG